MPDQRSSSPESLDSAPDLESELTQSPSPTPDDDMITKPKRPLCAYNIFFRDQREMLLQTLPAPDVIKEGKHGKISFQELAKTIAASWKAISSEDKERYEKIAASGRADYKKVVKEWKMQQKRLGKPTVTKRKRKAHKKAQTISPVAGSQSKLSCAPIGPARNFSMTIGMNVHQVNTHRHLYQPRSLQRHYAASAEHDFEYGRKSSESAPVYRGGTNLNLEPIPAFNVDRTRRSMDFPQPANMAFSLDTSTNTTLYEGFFSRNVGNLEPVDAFPMEHRQQQQQPQQQEHYMYSSSEPVLACDAFEPLPCDFQSEEQHVVGEPSLNGLASRLGQDCVKHLVEIFDDTNDYQQVNLHNRPFHIDQFYGY